MMQGTKAGYFRFALHVGPSNPRRAVTGTVPRKSGQSRQGIISLKNSGKSKPRETPQGVSFYLLIELVFGFWVCEYFVETYVSYLTQTIFYGTMEVT